MSLFDIIERFEVEEFINKDPVHLDQSADSSLASVDPKQPPFLQLMSFRVAVTWMKLPDDDPKQEYEHEFAICLPDGKEKILVQAKGIYFENDDRPLNRYTMKIHGPPFTQPGRYRVESRMRPVGDTSDNSWKRQDYPFLVSIKESSEEEFNMRF